MWIYIYICGCVCEFMYIFNMYLRMYLHMNVCIYVFIYILFVCVCFYVYMYAHIIFFTFPIFLHLLPNFNSRTSSDMDTTRTKFLHWTYSAKYQLLTGKSFVERNSIKQTLIMTDNAGLLACRSSIAVLIPPGAGASHVVSLAFYKINYWKPGPHSSVLLLQASSPKFRTLSWTYFRLRQINISQLQVKLCSLSHF